MNYRIFSLVLSIIILSHLLLERVDEINDENIKLKLKPSKPKKIKEDIVQYNIENFESDLDIDDELDYDLDLQYKYRDDNLKIDIPKISDLPGQNDKKYEKEVVENPTLYKWDEQTKSNMYYSDPSAAQGIRTLKPEMYHPKKNEKIINGGYVDRDKKLMPYDIADCGYAAI